MTPAHPPIPITAAIGIGSNLGPREAHIAAAFDALSLLPNTAVLSRSSIIQTAPVGPVPQGQYLNAAAAISTSLSPSRLLAHLLRIESSRGRDRSKEQRWGPRTLDLDLLLYADQIINEPGLSVPHPRLSERAFVLIPLAQLLPDARVPGDCRTVSQLLSALTTAAPSPTSALPSRA